MISYTPDDDLRGQIRRQSPQSDGMTPNEHGDTIWKLRSTPRSGMEEFVEKWPSPLCHVCFPTSTEPFHG